MTGTAHFHNTDLRGKSCDTVFINISCDSNLKYKIISLGIHLPKKKYDGCFVSNLKCIPLSQCIVL